MKLFETKSYINGKTAIYNINDEYYRFAYFTDSNDEITIIKIFLDIGGESLRTYNYETLSKYTEEEWFQYSLVDEWLMSVKQFIEEVP